MLIESQSVNSLQWKPGRKSRDVCLLQTKMQHCSVAGQHQYLSQIQHDSCELEILRQVRGVPECQGQQVIADIRTLSKVQSDETKI